MSDAGNDKFLDGVFAAGGVSAAFLRAREQQRFEQSLLRAIFKVLDLPGGLMRVRKTASAATGRPEPTLAAFDATFPSFPFRLSADVLRGSTLQLAGKDVTLPHDYAVHRDNRSVEPARFRDYLSVPAVAVFLAHKAAGGEDARCCALVYPRKGVRQGMVVHDDVSEQYWTAGLSWVYKMPDETRLYVQPFLALLAGVRAAGWRPVE